MRNARRRGSNARASSLAACAAAAAVLLDAAHGQVITDGSLGPARTLAGPDFAVTPDLGRQVGGNLFHSLSRLDLAAGQTATFSGPPSVTTVLARVTGGQPSTIGGTLRCTIPAADFYLVNRAGVVFTSTASIEVGGSFAATTADVVRLRGGGAFPAAPATPDAELLTSATPAAFGFLAEPTGTIRADGLRVASVPGKSLVLVGGEVKLVGTLLAAQSGKVELAAVRSAGDLAVDVSDVGAAVDASAFVAPGPVELSFSTLDASGPAGGRINVDGGDVRLEGSLVSSDGTGAGAGLPVGLRARGTLTVGDNSRVSTLASFAAAGGDVTLRAGAAVVIGGGSAVSAATIGGGAGGDVTLDAGAAGVVRLEGDAFTTNVLADVGVATAGAGGNAVLRGGTVEVLGNALVAARTFGTGDAGGIAVEADALRIDARGNLTTGLFSETVAGSSGRAGGVGVNVRDLDLRDGTISATTSGAGAGGAIEITGERLQVGGAGRITAVASGSLGPAAAGGVRVRADAIRFEPGGRIASTASDTGPGGAVDVVARDVAADAADGDLFTGILSQADAAGDGGPLRVAAETVRLARGALILTLTQGTGRGGDASVTATRSFEADGATTFETGLVSRTTLAGRPAGRGGDLTLDAPLVRLHNGAVDSLGIGGGDAGAVRVTADDVVMREPVRGPGVTARGSISSTAAGGAEGGAGGDVRVTAAGSIELHDGAFITTESITARRSGDVEVRAGRLVLSGANVPDSGRIVDLPIRLPDGTRAKLPVAATTEIGSTSQLGPAGDILIDVGELTIVNNAYVSASTAGPGDGGDVVIRADKVRIAAEGSPFLTGVFAASLLRTAGAGGSITFEGRGGAGGVGELAVVDGGIISADTFGAGAGGNVTIRAGRALFAGSDRATTPTGVSVQTEDVAGGAGGGLRIEAADALDVRDGAVVSASTFGVGRGGPVTLASPLVSVGGGFVASASDGPGDAGDVTITSPGSITLSRGAVVSAAASGSGAGGSVTLDARELNVDAASVLAASTGVGLAGSVAVRAGDHVTMREGASISTSADQTSGGNVDIRAVNLLDLRDSRIAASAGEDGGNMNIDPRFVLLNRSHLAANAVRGNGGNMQIVAGTFLQSAGSTIDVSSRFGLAGSVSITAPDVDVAGALVALPGGVVDTQARLVDLCGLSAGGAFSSFVITSRGGAALTPDAFAPSYRIALPAGAPRARSPGASSDREPSSHKGETHAIAR